MLLLIHTETYMRLCKMYTDTYSYTTTDGVSTRKMIFKFVLERLLLYKDPNPHAARSGNDWQL